MVHKVYRLTTNNRGDLSFFVGDRKLGWNKRAKADRVQIQTRRLTPRNWSESASDDADSRGGPLKVIPRVEAVITLRGGWLEPRVGDPAQHALHSGRTGGATHLAGRRTSPLQTKKAGRCKSQAFMAYVRLGSEGSSGVSQTLAS